MEWYRCHYNDCWELQRVVGKTTNAVLNSYEFAKKGKRTLLVDLDPQSNATKSLMLTKSILNPDEKVALTKTLMKGNPRG